MCSSLCVVSSQARVKIQPICICMCLLVHARHRGNGCACMPSLPTYSLTCACARSHTHTLTHTHTQGLLLVALISSRGGVGSVGISTAIIHSLTCGLTDVVTCAIYQDTVLRRFRGARRFIASRMGRIVL